VNNDFFYDDLITAPGDKKWLCFDEIHKMPKWKNLLKGYFDEFEGKTYFIITGSARLDLMKKSGDSLTGRYFLYKLFPLIYNEIETNRTILNPPVSARNFIETRLSTKSHKNTIDSLLEHSGFPEPFLKNNKIFLKKWRDDFTDRLIKDDLRDLTGIHDVEKVATLLELLPSKIGNPLSLNSMREDLGVSHTSIRSWLRSLELTYSVFTLSAYSKKITRSIKKEKKLYLFDWSRISDPALRFENYIACELLAQTAYWNEFSNDTFDLNYIRTKDGKETDFLITRSSVPWLLIECKYSETFIEKHHIIHSRMLGGIPVVQLSYNCNTVKKIDNTWQVPAERFL